MTLNKIKFTEMGKDEKLVLFSFFGSYATYDLHMLV